MYRAMSFVIAEVNKPIIGMDFLSYLNLLVNSKIYGLIEGETLSKIYLTSFTNISMPMSSITSNLYENTFIQFSDLLRLSTANRKVKDHDIEIPRIFAKIRRLYWKNPKQPKKNWILSCTRVIAAFLITAVQVPYIDREFLLLAIYIAIKHFKHVVEGR